MRESDNSAAALFSRIFANLPIDAVVPLALDVIPVRAMICSMHLLYDPKTSVVSGAFKPSVREKERNQGKPLGLYYDRGSRELWPSLTDCYC